ncbi:Npt1/Npt2 family nucleotide transporter [Paenibacillus thalictri]|uniref:ADP,ATP carrier protein n=1 Tax=Paenibacillus thalictri TaxID=2527873 RepID=A0A4Q9DWH8_9BACL|nr:Npt1/Npt2 family nucleotide transporter [Paenibacillus thalictri]TBL80359.1 cyclic nucleotide-binding domain-containing protein [Paenibacillus thalictri]
MDRRVSSGTTGRLIGRWIHMSDRDEYSKVILLFCYLFCVSSASTIGRTAADTLFLSKYSASQLSYMYLPQAATLLLVGFLFQKYCAKLRIHTLCAAVIVIVSVLSLGSRLLVGFGLDWILPVIYIGYDVFNFLMIVCFWQFATAVMDQRKAKKLINWVGSGGIVGGIASGFGLKLAVKPLGTENLIFVYAGLQLLCLLFVILIIRSLANPQTSFATAPPSAKPGPGSGEKKKQTGGKTENALFRQVPHLKYIAIISAALTISLTLIDYQFKTILRGSLQNEEMAGFMGSFYGYAGIFALLIQFFVIGKVFTKFGVITALTIFPFILLTGSVSILFAPVLALAVMLKGSDKVLGDTIHSSALQLVMFPIPPEYRSKAKGFMDGVVRNGSKGIASISLILLSPILTIGQFGYIIVALLVCGIYSVFRVKPLYLQMLLSTLQTRNIEPQEGELNMLDPASQSLLTTALHSGEKSQALYAMRILQNIPAFDLNPHIPELLKHPAPEVRNEALQYIGRKQPAGCESDLTAMLACEESAMMPQALIALSSYGDDQHLDLVGTFLESGRVELKAAAIAGLVKHYGIEGMFRAVGTLKELLKSERESERIAVASVFGQIEIASFYKPLTSLLADPSHRVRIAALQSAEKLTVPELVPYIVPLLKSSRTRQKAIEALGAYQDNVIIPTLLTYLQQHDMLAQYIPRIFERIGSQVAFDALLERYGETTSDIKGYVLEALNHMKMARLQAERKTVEQIIISETERYWQFVAHTEGLDGIAQLKTVEEAAKDIRFHYVSLIFQLLSLLFDNKTIQAVYNNWRYGDARRQANAAEVIDQLLEGDLRTRITKLIEPLPSKNQLPDAAVEKHLLALLASESGWLKLCIAESLLSSEAADRWPQAAEKVRQSMSGEEIEQIREQAEKVRLLRRVSIFEGISDKNLSSIAELLMPETAAPGDAIIREREAGDAMFLIQEGKASVHRNQVYLAQLQEGECFGEMSVLTGIPRTATIIAETGMKLWRLDSSSFYDVVLNETSTAIGLMKLLSRRIRGANNKAVQTAKETAFPYAVDAAAASETVPKPVERQADSLDALQSLNSETILRRVFLLQKIELFSQFTQEDYVRLAKMAQDVALQPGETVFAEGDEGDAMYGILSGSIQVHKGEQKLAELAEGQIFGEMSIIDGEPRSAGCRALTRTELIQITQEQVAYICFQRIEVMKGMLRELANRLHTVQSR